MGTYRGEGIRSWKHTQTSKFSSFCYICLNFIYFLSFLSFLFYFTLSLKNFFSLSEKYIPKNIYLFYDLFYLFWRWHRWRRSGRNSFLLRASPRIRSAVHGVSPSHLSTSRYKIFRKKMRRKGTILKDLKI